MRNYHFRNISIFMVLLIFGSINAQDSLRCKLIKKDDRNFYLVSINDENFLVIPAAAAKKALKAEQNFKTAQEEIRLKDSLLAKYDSNLALYDSTYKHMKGYIKELEFSYNGYKNLLSDYKKLKSPTIGFQVAVGATGDDLDPAVLAGFRIYRVYLLGILQKKNSGLLIGTHFDIY